MKSLTAILLISILLSGCFGTLPGISVKDKIDINPSVLESCLPLREVPHNATFSDILVVSVKNAEVYLDCKRKQDTSIQVIKEITNNND